MTNIVTSAHPLAKPVFEPMGPPKPRPKGLVALAIRVRDAIRRKKEEDEKILPFREASSSKNEAWTFLENYVPPATHLQGGGPSLPAVFEEVDIVPTKESHHLTSLFQRANDIFKEGGFNQIYKAKNEQLFPGKTLVYRKGKIGSRPDIYDLAINELQFLKQLISLRTLNQLPPFFPEIFDAQIFKTNKKQEMRLGVLMSYYSDGDLKGKLKSQNHQWNSCTKEEKEQIGHLRIAYANLIIQSVTYFHRMGYMHRDIKPENFLPTLTLGHF